MAITIVGRAITLWREIRKRSYESTYQKIQKIKQRRYEKQLMLSHSWKGDNQIEILENFTF